MTKLIDAMRTKDMVTENGMPTNSTSLDPIVDLFFIIGAMRKESERKDGQKRLISKFLSAYHTDPLLAMKTIFWARDIRGGAGERNVFNVIMKYLAINKFDVVVKNMRNIPIYGRWADMFIFIDTPFEKEMLSIYAEALKNKDGLASKWAPRLGGKISKEKKLIANKLRVFMELTPKEYRKMIVDATNVIETAMCNKEFGAIDYNKVPSLAMSRYMKAFTKNDNDRFEKYIKSLEKCEAKINTSAVYPYDIIKSLQSSNSNAAVEQWKALPNYLENVDERLLCVVDTSGSMSISVSGTNLRAIDISVSLGLYFSERLNGSFKDSFITFSEKPTLQVLKGDLRSRLSQIKNASWGFNTNLELVFKTVLNKAESCSVPEHEMPTTILIISDMEFDQATKNPSNSALEMIRENYEKSGYTMPKIIFWNVVSRSGQVPVKYNENGVSLVSGFSPAIVKSVLTGEVTNPIQIVKKILNDEKYDRITI